MSKPNLIQKATIDYFNISMADLMGTTRDRYCVTARHVAWYLERKRGLSYSSIARLYGGRDHTTIIAAMNHLDERLAASDARYLPAIIALEAKINPPPVAEPIEAVACACEASILELRRQLELIQRRLDELGAKP